jgi:hypothetical protein
VKWLIAVVAFVSGLLTFLVLAGIGLTLLLVPNSGEQGAGALLTFGSTIAFAAALILLFAPDAVRKFGGGTLAIGLGTLAALPVAMLALAALGFAGVPWGGRSASLDWGSFLAGLALALGAASLLLLAYRRSGEASGAARPRGSPRRRTAGQQLQSAMEHDRDIHMQPPHDDVRVTRL